MKKKSGIILNIAGILLTLALLVMLFVPYFPAVGDAGEAQSVSIMGYVMNPLDKTAVAPLIAENNARLGEAAPNVSNYVVPVMVLFIVGILVVIFALILLRKELPGFAYLLMGALTIGVFVSDKQYAIGGVLYALFFVIAAILLVLGTFMSFLLLKRQASAKEMDKLSIVLIVLTVLVFLTAFGITFRPTDITFAPGSLGETVANNPYVAEGPVAFGWYVLSPAVLFFVLLVTAVLGIFFYKKSWIRYCYLVSGLIATISLIINPAYNCEFITRSIALCGALLLLIIAAVNLVISVLCKKQIAEKSGEAPRKLSAAEKDHTIYAVLSAVLILIILCTVFTVAVVSTGVTVSVAKLGDTDVTNPYLAKWVTRMPGNGEAALANPALMALILFAFMLIGLVCRKKVWTMYLNIASSLVALYTLLSNRVFANNPLVLYAAVPAAGILLVLAIVSLVRYLLVHPVRNIAGLNFVSLIAMVMVVVFLFMPFWTVEDKKSSKTPTRSVVDLMTMRADQLPADDNTVANAAAKIKKALAMSSKKTVGEVVEDTKQVKKIVDALATVCIPTTLLDQKMTSTIRSEQRLTGGDEAATYTSDVLSLWFVPAMIILGTAVYMVLCMIKRDEGWIAVLSLLTAVFGLAVFIACPEFQFSTLRLYTLALCALVVFISLMNIAAFINVQVESKREREKYLYEDTEKFFARKYRRMAADAMKKGNTATGIVMLLIHLAVAAAIIVCGYFAVKFIADSFTGGNPLYFILGAVLIVIAFILFGFNVAANANAMLKAKRTGKLSLGDYFAVLKNYKFGIFNGFGMKLLLFPNLGFVIYFAVKGIMDLCGKTVSPIVYVIAAAFELYGILLSYKLTTMPYIQSDNAHFTANESADGSGELIKRNKWQMFCLDISYTGWYLLGLLTGGILILWVYPKHQLARAFFYDNLIEERDRMIKKHH